MERVERIHIANDADAWERGGRVKKVYYEPRSEPGLVLTGASGSGKTFQALMKLGKLGLNVTYDRENGIRAGPRAIISDFKGDRAFRFLLDGNNPYIRPEGMTTHYGYFKDAASAIRQYDNEFRSRLAGSSLVGSDDDSPFHLYIDELPSLLSSLPKAERSEMDSNIFQYLAMNRNLGLSLTLACQRFDSAWFSPGARENVCSRSGLGALSRDSAKMLFPETDTIEPQGTGRGYYQAGATFTRIIVPFISDMEKLRLCIWRLVTW